MKKISLILILLGLFLVPAIMQAQDTQEDEDVSHTLGYGTHSSYVIADVDQFDLITKTDSVLEFAIRNKSQKRLMYHVVIELEKEAGTINSDTDSTFFYYIYDKVGYAEDYTQVAIDSITTNADDYTITIATNSFNISEFIKIRLFNDGYDEVALKVESMFIKIVEE